MQTVYRGKYLTVRRWWERGRDGKKHLFEQVRRPDSVVILSVDQRGRLILLRERRYGMRRYIWNVPSGKVDRGQKPLTAARQELLEEAGFSARRWKRVGEEKHRSSVVAWNLYVYVAQQLHERERPSGDPHEATRPVPVSLRKAYALALEGKMHYADVGYYIIRLWRERNNWLT